MALALWGDIGATGAISSPSFPGLGGGVDGSPNMVGILLRAAGGAEGLAGVVLRAACLADGLRGTEALVGADCRGGTDGLG